MKVTVPTHVFLDGVSHGASVAASKSPKQVLECLVLRADARMGLSLEATDLDVGLRIHLAESEADEDGTVVVPAARLLAVAREVDEDSTTFEADDGTLVLATGRSRFRVRGESQDDLVILPRFPPSAAAQVPAPLLRDMIRRTVFATAKEAGRFALHGVLLVIRGDQIEMVATDGRRLARVISQLPEPAARDLRVILGPKGLALLDRLLAGSAYEHATVAVAQEERQVMFQVGDALVISRLIDGSFPSYEDVIPKRSLHQLTVTVADLAGALRQAALLTTRDALSVEFGIEEGELTIRSRALDIGEATARAPIQYEGPSVRIGFNPVFVQEALKVMEPAASLRLSFTDAKAPTLLTDREDFTYVVMPIALE